MNASTSCPLAYRNAATFPRNAARRVAFFVACSVASVVFLLLTTPSATAQVKRIQPNPTTHTEPLAVFAAADMQPVFDVLGPYFERRTGIKLNMTYGSSATLSAQIVNGAPADIFFSADYSFAERIVAAGKTEVVDPIPYAKGILVLWARNDSRFKPLSIDTLSRADLHKVAIADPNHAPYGRAAMAAIIKMKFLPNVQKHLVQAESVGQAAQFALSGNADLALISQTIALSPQYKSAGTAVMFPLSTYPDIRQCAVIIKQSQHRQDAHSLLNYITSDDIQAHLPELGLQPFQ